MWLLSLFYAFVIISVSIGIGRLIPEDKILRLEGSILFRSLALSCIIIFLVIAYLSKPMYYFPRNNGFLGDNYYHIGWALEDGNYLKSHHILYPLLPGKLVSWSVAMGALDKQDPFFYEKAYRLAGLPVRLAVSVAMLLFSLSIFKITKSSLNALMAFFFLATSYSFWMWGLHSNAIGLAIAVSLLTFMVGANWYATGKKRSLFLLGIFSSLCVFAHNSQLFAAIGIFVAVLYVVFGIQKNGLRINAYRLMPFMLSVIPLALLFYLIQSSIWNEFNPIILFQKASDVNYFGGFGIQGNGLVSAMDSVIRNAIYQITNINLREFSPFWKPEIIEVQKTIIDKTIYPIHVGSLLAIVFFILWNYEKLSFSATRGLVIFSAITSIVFFLGLLMRPAGYYAAAATPSHLVLLASLLFSIKGNLVILPRSLILFTFAISGIIYNTLSTANVYQGKDINEHPYYAESSLISSYLEAGDEAVYYRNIDITYYPNASLKYYYKNKFNNLEWRWSNWEDMTKLEVEIENLLEKKQKRVFIGPEIINNLNYENFTNLEAVAIEKNLMEIKAPVNNDSK